MPLLGLAPLDGSLGGEGSGGGGTKTAARAVNWNLEGYRYIQIRCKTTDAAQSVTFRLSNAASGEDKSYSFTTGEADTFEVVKIDLCMPDDQADDDDSADDDVYTQESRYPLGGSALPTLSDALWGFNTADQVELTFPSGQILTIDYIRLARDTFAKVTYLPAFELWKTVFPSLNGKTAFWTDADGRVADLYMQTESGGTYAWESVTDHAADVADRLGWTVAAGGPFPTDGYHSNSLEALLTGGSGVSYAWGSTWDTWIDRDVSSQVNVPAQMMWDEAVGYPGIGECWTSGSYGTPMLLKAAKVGRGMCWGLVFSKSSLEPEAGTTVTLKTFSGVFAGSGVTGAQGEYGTGSPFGKKATSIAYCRNLESPSFTVYNRFRHRRSWLPSFFGSGVSLAVRSDWYMALARVESGEIVLNFAYEGEPMGPDVNTGITSVGQASVCWAGGSGGALAIAYTTSGYVVVRTSEDDGATWSATVTISAGPNTHPALTVTPDGVRHVYWISGGNTVKGRLLDTDDTPLGSEFTVLTPVDDSGLAVDSGRAGGGQVMIEMAYINGGSVEMVRSEDGETFA